MLPPMMVRRRKKERNSSPNNVLYAKSRVIRVGDLTIIIADSDSYI